MPVIPIRQFCGKPSLAADYAAIEAAAKEHDLALQVFAFEGNDDAYGTRWIVRVERPAERTALDLASCTMTLGMAFSAARRVIEFGVLPGLTNEELIGVHLANYDEQPSLATRLRIMMTGKPVLGADGERRKFSIADLAGFGVQALAVRQACPLTGA